LLGSAIAIGACFTLWLCYASAQAGLVRYLQDQNTRRPGRPPSPGSAPEKWLVSLFRPRLRRALLAIARGWFAPRNANWAR